MIVTIDGPAGAGKSSVSRQLASRIGFAFLDTGAMYRAVTWATLETGAQPSNSIAVQTVTSTINLQFQDNRVFVDGNDVSQAIRSTTVTNAVSEIADNPHVRQHMVMLQREIAAGGNYVCEGRDQGTIVFPDAECKIFLTATAEARAQRRLAQMASQGTNADFQEILSLQNERDRRDESRPIGGLKKADDAIEVLSDDKTLAQVVDELEAIVLSRRQGKLRS